MNLSASQQNLKRLLSTFIVIFLSASIPGNVVIGQETTQDCSESKLALCRNVLTQKHELPGMGPLFSQDTIHRACGVVLDADQCVKHMYQSCPELQSLPKPAPSTESILEIQKCRILTDRYVHNLVCYEELNSTYQRCLDREPDTFQKNVDRVREGNRELQQEGCCKIRRVFECILTPTGQHCGKEAMSIMDDFLHTSLPSGMWSTCLQYKCLSQSEESNGTPDSKKHHPENGHEDHRSPSSGRQLSFLNPFFILSVTTLAIFK